MKVTNSNVGAQGAGGAAPASQTERSAPAKGSSGSTQVTSPSTDDVHLSQLVKNLRSLAADSPERQNKIEQLTRSYASGSYHVDAQATAGAIISDATKG